MRKAVHILTGMVAFAAYSFVLAGHANPPAATWAFGLAAAGLGSLLPGILEPAGGPHHRAFFHSRRVLFFALAGFCLLAPAAVLLAPLPAFRYPYYAASFLLGYALHLLADSLTRAGLPR